MMISVRNLHFGEIEGYGKYPKKLWLRNYPQYIDFHPPNFFPALTINEPQLFGTDLGVLGLLGRLFRYLWWKAAPRILIQNTSALTPVSSRDSAPRRDPQYGVWKLSLTHKPDSLTLLLTKSKFLSSYLIKRRHHGDY